MSAYLDWHVGMKVVCVDDQWSGGGLHDRGVPCPLRAGAVYTVSGIKDAGSGIYLRPSRAPICIVLAEVAKPRHPELNHSPGFNAARFRKVETRKYDISIFTSMLNTTKKVVDA